MTENCVSKLVAEKQHICFTYEASSAFVVLTLNGKIKGQGIEMTQDTDTAKC